MSLLLEIALIDEAFEGPLQPSRARLVRFCVAASHADPTYLDRVEGTGAVDLHQEIIRLGGVLDNIGKEWDGDGGLNFEACAPAQVFGKSKAN
jgi:hypothetical protein